jgi:hypothetical protein
VEASVEDLRTAQDRLVQTEKLASLGQLTAGIAHEMSASEESKAVRSSSTQAMSLSSPAHFTRQVIKFEKPPRIREWLRKLQARIHLTVMAIFFEITGGLNR